MRTLILGMLVSMNVFSEDIETVRRQAGHQLTLSRRGQCIENYQLDFNVTRKIDEHTYEAFGNHNSPHAIIISKKWPLNPGPQQGWGFQYVETKTMSISNGFDEEVDTWTVCKIYNPNQFMWDTAKHNLDKNNAGNIIRVRQNNAEAECKKMKVVGELPKGATISQCIAALNTYSPPTQDISLEAEEQCKKMKAAGELRDGVGVSECVGSLKK